eukprot:403498_1
MSLFESVRRFQSLRVHNKFQNLGRLRSRCYRSKGIDSKAFGSLAKPTLKLEAEYPLYLGSKPVYTKDTVPVLDKSTNEECTRVCLATHSDIDRAIGLAAEAAGPMARMPTYARKHALCAIVAELKGRHEELAMALCIEAGKPIKDARGEVTRCIDTFEIAAEECTRLYGEYAQLDISPMHAGFQSIQRRFPVGPVSMIAPFNFPLNLVAHKVAPALACGCPFVLKPSSRTPIGALILGEIMSKLDELPEGAFSVLPCEISEADLFTTDERIKLVSFTGSPSVGWDIKSRAGKKKVVLELGGNAACIIDEGTNLDDAVPRVITGAFYQSGQSCISVQRIYVHASIYEDFKRRFIEQTNSLKKGDPSNEDTFIGPMITENDAKRCEQWVNEATERGASVIAGGKRDGVFYDATVVENVPKGTNLCDAEVFGPVCMVQKFDDFKDAISEVNDSVFGLQAGVFTSDMNKAFYAYENLEVGGVVINDVPSKRVDSMPYGGIRDSGLGREGIRYAIDDMTEIKIMLMRNMGML